MIDKTIEKINKITYQRTFGLLETLTAATWLSMFTNNPTIKNWLIGFALFTIAWYTSKQIRKAYKWT